MSASSDEIPLSLSLPRPLQASPVCEALQFFGDDVINASGHALTSCDFPETLISCRHQVYFQQQRTSAMVRSKSSHDVRLLHCCSLHLKYACRTMLTSYCVPCACTYCRSHLISLLEHHSCEQIPIEFVYPDHLSFIMFGNSGPSGLQQAWWQL